MLEYRDIILFMLVILGVAIGVVVILASSNHVVVGADNVTTNDTNATLYVFTNPLGTIYVSDDGVVWVELNTITNTIEYMNQRVYVYIDAVRTNQTVNVTETDIWGRTTTYTKPVYDYYIVLQNLCMDTSGLTCQNVTYLVYNSTGALIANVTLDGINDTEARVELNESMAIVYMVSGNTTYGPYLVKAEESLVEDVTNPWILMYLPLIPIALFIALAVRSGLKYSGLGLIAYAFIARWLIQLLGLNMNLAPAITVISLVLGVVFILVEIKG